MSAAAGASSLLRPVRGLVRSAWNGLTLPPRPLVGIEVHEMALGVVKIRRERGGAVIEAIVEQPLPPGVVAPSISVPGVREVDAFEAALHQALERAGALGERRVSLVLPDMVARVAILGEGEVTLSRGVPADDVLRFRLKDRVPFDIRDARLSCVPAGGVSNGSGWVVAAALREVLDGYEATCADLDLEVGRVELSGLALLRGLMRSSPSGDWLLVQWAGTCVSLFLWREGVLALARTVAGAAGPTEVVREVASTVLYHRERLGGQLTGAALRVVGHSLEETQALLEGPLGLWPEPVDAGGAREAGGQPVQAAMAMISAGAMASVLSEEA
jgi:hypothetical protein